MKNLTHNQLVRGFGFPCYCQKIAICTLEGYFRENLLKYHRNDIDTAEKLENAVLAEVSASVARDEECCRATQWAWTLQAPAVLTENYAGKSEAMKAERDAIAAAPALENGEVIDIDGRKYRVRLMGYRFSDPIHFDLVN